MSDIDIVMEVQAGPSTSTPSLPTSSPLSFDIASASARFCSDLGVESVQSGAQSGLPQVLLDAAFHDDPSAVSPVQVVTALSELLSRPAVAPSISRHYSPLLLDLLVRWEDDAQSSSQETWENRLYVLASIAELRPDLWSFISRFINLSPFRQSPLAPISSQLLTVESTRLQHLLLSFIRLLTADPEIASRSHWPLEPLHTLRTQHSSLGVRLLAIQALSKQRKWSEIKRMKMEEENVGAVDKINVPISFGWEIVKSESGGTDIREQLVDGWLLALMEAKRIDQARKAESLEQSPARSPLTLPAQDFSPRLAIVADSLLLRDTIPRPTSPPFHHVETAATNSALQRLVPSLILGVPQLITSAPSSGKTHILHYLSSRIYPDSQPTNRILTIPLADTTIDVKSLIGTYVSSPTKPGTFEWMEGALAKAVRAGRWVVFDDIDRASTEMLVTISGLTRSLQTGRPGRRARLDIPGREDIEAGEGFALFATRTTRQDSIVPPVFFGAHNLHEVILDAPTDQDILAILSARFPRIPGSVTTALVEIWQLLRPLSNIGGPVKGRDIGLRDLEKWCARVERNLPSSASLAALESNPAGPFANPVLQDEILLEAADCFMAWFDARSSSVEKRAAMIRVVAERIGVDEERAFSLLDTRRPQLEISTATKQLRCGRTTMPIYPAPRRQQVADSRPFALTKPSLVLLERIAATASMSEPTLLVGETGTGKTTAVQHIASICRKPLTVLNLSTQTESSDLLGGFKPIDAGVAARVLHARWQKLFSETFSMAKPANGTYLEAASKALNGRKWGRLAELWSSSARRAIDKLLKKDESEQPRGEDGAVSSPRKKRKVNTKVTKAGLQWQSLLVDIADFDLHHVKMKSKLVFSFVEGPLVKALREGEWLLLDEVNLASQETLEAISTLLEGSAASLVLTERGDVEPVPRHPDFRLFACMNPATDVGKKDLPPNLRARFTELYVPPPDDDREALTTIVSQYLGDATAGDRAVILDVVEMYSTLKRLSATKEIVDGSNVAPHFSMRTLARALMFAVETAPLFGLRRGLWEGCLMAFTMSLEADSIRKAHEVCEKYLLAPMKNARAVLSQIPSLPASADPDDYVRFGPFWLKRGPMPPAPESRYVITPSVQAKLSDLARVILTHRYPVLIQGPTSAGKTSAVEFLARQTGHRFVRINNHEHTDIQEYLGTYVTDPQSGNLVFQEGLLVTAVRQGHWIVLDELNLAPTDVLEALNRLLDDNRELVIPETQEVIKPHPNFILFATQNPPGLYAGRKVLSRAFRNRFLEVHFDDVPKDELETILCQRCQIAPSYAKKIVQVFEELRHRRQASRVFESKSSFATLRDLFRWAERGAVGYQQLADDGYMLLAERARQDDDKVVIKQVIEDIMKVSINSQSMYRLFDSTSSALARLPFANVPETTTMVWTNAMQRLFILVAAALAHKEPVLLVGETGCGKTSICEVVAQAFGQTMVGVNCHQNMETADLLGSQRPVRNRLERRAKVYTALNALTPVPSDATDDDLLAICQDLLKTPDVDPVLVKALQQEIKAFSALFEWSDGPLVHAMHAGDLLLLDEVSLADDSVLERLNSVLEPGRTLVLAEKGGNDIDAATLVADDRFHVVATMNPGGDFGKKELSPALRNRFTEIWVPPLDDRNDLLQIIGQSWKVKECMEYGPLILDFFDWFGQRVGDAAGLGLRDILAWVRFMDMIVARGVLDVAQAFEHGGEMVLVDGLESLPQVAGMSTASVAVLRQDCLDKLRELSSTVAPGHRPSSTIPQVEITSDKVTVGGFGVHKGSAPSEAASFRLEAPTTALNAMRVLRGCQLPKAILLEGSPGVGKTSLVSALSALTGHTLQRINLSDQTDLIDLFGSDLPVEGGSAGEFQWRDAAFLDAMQKGHWVLLDEMNLASQTVLEGLNAVLDHRGTVYIPELGRSFTRHAEFRVFAAQNPLQQGGGRKGLPKSFLNRFTKVYLQEHTMDDLWIICKSLHSVPEHVVRRMIEFNEAIRRATMVTRSIGTEGSPWEFNLRDLFRWFGLMSRRNGLELSHDPVEYLRLVYTHRFRNSRDRLAVNQLFNQIFQVESPSIRPTEFITPSHVQIGHSLLGRSATGSGSVDVTLPCEHLDIAESVLKSIEMGWLVILAGSSGVGKRRLIQHIAAAAGRDLGEFAMHPGVDTSEILGSFEQQDFGRLLNVAFGSVVSLIDSATDMGMSLGAQVEQLRGIHDACAKTPDDETISRVVAVSQSIIESLSALPLDFVPAQAALKALAKSGPHSTGFAWIDGHLLKAIRQGGWYHISNANLCSASVLDRLNSLCENDGVLVLSEKGSETGNPEVIKPHPDFRLFMSFDPRFGELSRAMRNRGAELYVEDPQAAVSSTTSCAQADDHVLVDNSILRRLQRMDPSLNVSDLANEVSAQSSLAKAHLHRLLDDSKVSQAIKAFVADEAVVQTVQAEAQTIASPQGLSADFCAGLPIDVSVNPNIPTSKVDALFRLLQLHLRNVVQKEALETFITLPQNSKSILSLSAIASRRGPSRKKAAAGSELWPFISAFRAHLADSLMAIQATSTETDVTGHLEQVLVLLTILEERARGPTFDYSATQLLAGWLNDAIAGLQGMESVVAGVRGLAQSVEITSGHGQSEIWGMFRQDGRIALDAELSESLHSLRDITMRQAVFRALVAGQTSDEDGLEQLKDLLRDMPRDVKEEQNQRWTDWPVLSSVELNAIAKSIQGTPAQQAIELLVGEPTNDIQSLVDLGSLESSAFSPSAVFSALSAWLSKSWKHALSPENPGPGELFSPSWLASVLRFSAQGRMSMKEIPQQEEALRFTIDSVLWKAKVKPEPRSEAVRMATTSLALILSAFGFSFDIRQESAGLAQQISSIIQSASMPAWLSDAFNSTLSRPLAAVQRDASALNTIGDLWIGLSQFVFAVYVTNIPIDPAVRRILQGEVLALRIAQLEEERDAIAASEARAKGTSTSRRLDDTQHRLSVVQDEHAALGTSTSRSTDAARLNVLFNEVHSFASDAMDVTKVAGLAAVIKKGDKQAAQREEGFQAVSGAFIHRLEKNYGEMQDLIRPIISAVLFAKFGFRCLARDLQLRQASPRDIVVSAMAFPSIGLSSTGSRSSDILSQILSAASLARHLAVPVQRQVHLKEFVTRLDDLYATWSAIRLREQREAQEADSLYRVRKTEVDVLSDEEQEEKEFKELFPSFEGVGDEPDQPTESEEKKDDEQEEGSGKFAHEKIVAFHRLISTAFSSGSIDTTYVQSIDELLHSLDVFAYTEDLDHTSLAFQVTQLDRRQNETGAASSHPNFYTSANEPEVRKAHKILVRLAARLGALIEEWPDQMVLQHILERVERVLALDIRSSVALVLSALEGLLVHTDDWESYANRENTLKEYQNAISDLIIEWRKLELASWMRLLDDQLSSYVDKDAEWSLRLYGALIHGSLSATNAQDHIKTVLPLLRDYLSASTFGHFAPRLAVLRSFEKMAAELALLVSEPSQKAAMQSIATMLYNTITNFSLFAPRIADSLATQRGALDKSIKDFVKLASWKDVNVYALKASAVKSHRQLHRSIRKFRDVLQQPVSPILSDLNSLCPQEPAQISAVPAVLDIDVLAPSGDAVRARTTDELPDHLVRLEKTFERYASVFAQANQKAGERASIASDLDGLAVDIIETVQELAKATPSTLTEENKKIVNNLASRKRKAFADLLKALRALGFSNNVRADALAQQKDATWLAGRPHLEPEEGTGVDVEVARRVEGYHAKTGALILALREAFNGHNDDVNSQDLERGIGFVESIYASSISQRESLTGQISQLGRFTAIVHRLQQLAGTSDIGSGNDTASKLVSAELDLLKLRDGLGEVEAGVRSFRALERKAVSATDLNVVDSLKRDIEVIVSELSRVNASAKALESPMYTPDELELLPRVSSIRERVQTDLSAQSDQSPELAHLYNPIVALAAAMGVEVVTPTPADIPDALWKSSDDLIQRLLVVAQQLKLDAPEVKEDERVHVPSETKHRQATIASLHIETIMNDLNVLITSLSETLSSGKSTSANLLLARLLPFVQVLVSAYSSALNRTVYDVKSTYKLTYVVGRVMLDLAQKGYCKPSEADDSKDDQGGEGTVEGTGMGTGSGDKNVSNEITEESQVEGLQGEEEEEGGDDMKDEDDAVSMDDDFEGQMGEGKEKEPGEDDDDEGSEDEDHDEQVGDVDPLDPGAVDEKFWGDEDKQEEKDNGGREDLMEQGQEEQGEAELSAKEKEGEQKEKQEKKEESKEGEGEDSEMKEQNDAEGEKPEGAEEELGEDERDMPDEQEGQDEAQPPPIQDDVAMDEGDRLDLPEDLDFEEENDNGGLNDDLPDDAALPEDDEGEIERENDDMDMASQDDGEVGDDVPPAMEPTEEESKEEEAQMEQNLDVSGSNDVSAQDNDIAGGAGGTGEQNEEEEKEEGEGEDVEMADDENEADPAGQGAAPKNAGGPSNDQDPTADGPVDASGAPVPSDAAGQAQPQRSLGDIMKEIRRRRDEILNQQTRDESSDQPNAPQEAPGQVEYLGEEDEGDDQALGAAGEEERQKLADLNIVDDEAEQPALEDARPSMEDDEDDEEGAETGGERRQADRTVKAETKETSDAEKALTGMDIGGNAPTDRPDEQMDLDEKEEGVEVKDEKPDVEDDTVEIELNEITKVDPCATDGEEMWRQYAALTSDLSYALCEQLRLILEPTLATRLQGDFRTGKRLNMRKIIPYIASEYTKDKIWLRRTKPSRREYQVLLSLDDSRSMADSHSVHLAHQTLALVSQALNKLEVGQIGICKFGEGVDILHPFGTAFNDADGAKVMSSFKFDQHRTDVVKLVERTLGYMGEARQTQSASSTAPDLWQLQIIISDGVCQDHGRLRTLLRKAMEERVMIVFIIIDSLHTSPSSTTTTTAAAGSGSAARPSILSMQTVEYKNVNGEMNLEMTRYLDTFPFEFFVVLRDVEALPGVLSDTLRQWMTRVSQSNE